MDDTFRRFYFLPMLGQSRGNERYSYRNVIGRAKKSAKKTYLHAADAPTGALGSDRGCRGHACLGEAGGTSLHGSDTALVGYY